MADTDSTATQDPGSASPEVSAPQTASAPQTTPAQPDSSAGGESAWKNVANSANGAIAPQSGQNPSAPAQAQPTASTVSAPPPDAKAVRPGGIRGFIDKTLDSLAGTDTSRLRKDADGNLYVAHETMTRGQQWLKIAAKGIAGAAAGMEAGKGAGNWAKAPAAGVKAGQQFEDRQTEAEKNMMLEAANSQKLKHETASQAFQMTRLGVEAGQHDIEFSEKQADRLKAGGEEVAGHVGTLSELAQFMNKTSNFNKDQVQGHGMYTPVATYGPNGEANGFDIYKKTPGSDDEIVPAGTDVPFFNPVKNEIEYQKTAGPMKRADVNSVWMQAGNQRHKYQIDQATIDEKEGMAKKAAAEPQETPSTTALHVAETARAWAAKHKDDVEATKNAADNPNNGALIDSIGTGHISVGRMAYVLARNPALAEAVVEKYPDFDNTKVDQYAAAYKDFTEGTTAKQLNSGGTVLEHLNQLRLMNTPKSHIPGTTDYNAYHNQLNTLAPELTKFYGDQNIPAAERVLSTLGSTLPGTRDAAIRTQAQSMTAKFQSFKQQWKNAAPSKAYQAQMPWISPEAQSAWSELDKAYNPRANRAVAPATTAVQPGEPTARGADGKTLVVRNGQWVPAQQ